VTVAEFLDQFKEPIHILGWVAQGVFFTRFVIQWIASEKRKESVIPIGFWWCSISGGVLMLIYAFLIASPPIVIAQLFGLVVYARNLHFVYRARRIEREGAE